MRNPVWANIITQTITKLNKEYPGLPIGEHIAHALNGSDIYNISDREFAEALSSYIIELEMDEAFQQSDDNSEEYNE